MTMLEDDPDAGLVVDWRGKLSQNAATESIPAVKKESQTKTSAWIAATPVCFDLSDSEGTPIARPRPSGPTLAERRAAAAVKSKSMTSKQNSYADIVTLDSDSDEEITAGTTSKSDGKVVRLTQPRAHAELVRRTSFVEDEANGESKLSGTMSRSTETFPREGLLENAVSLAKDGSAGGSKFSGNPVKFTEAISLGALLEEPVSGDIEGSLVGSVYGRNDLRPQGETAAAVQMCDVPPLLDRAVPMSSDIPSTAWNTASPSDLKGSMQNCVIAGDNLIGAPSGSRKRPRLSAKGSVQSDPAQGVTRTAHDCVLEDKKRSCQPKPAVEVLTISDDDDIFPSTETQFPGKLGKCSEPTSEEVVLGKTVSGGSTRVKGSTNVNDVDEAVKQATAYVADFLPRRLDDNSLKLPDRCISLGSPVVAPSKTTEIDVGPCDDFGNVLSCAAEGPKVLDSVQDIKFSSVPVYAPEENRRISPVQPVFEILTSDDDAGNPEPDWLRDHEPASHNYGSEEYSGQVLPNSGGNDGGRDHVAGMKRTSSSATGFGSNKKRKTSVSSAATECPKTLGKVSQVVRNCPQAVNDSAPELNKWSFPEHAVFDLTGDDDDGSSESEWLRDREPVSPRLNLYSGGSVPHNLRFQDARDPFLPASSDSNISDHGLGYKRPLLRIPDLESPENRDTMLSPDSYDLELGERLSGVDKVKRRRRRNSGANAEERDDSISNSQRVSKARKGPVSEEELAAKQAQKQLERDLKKARQEEEKKRKQELKEELKRQKVEATEKRKQEKEIEKENNRWRSGKFALRNTVVYVDNEVAQMKSLGHLLLQQLCSKDYKYKIVSNPIQKTIVWKMRRPSSDSQVDTLGSQADDVINSQLSNSQLVLEEVEMKYVVVVLQGEEFADLVGQRKLLEYHSGLRNQYSSYSICYIINGLMKHLHKREQHQYRTLDPNWRRPDVEQALAEFVTHHPGVHSRLCIDESEIADHIVGLTRGLAECPFKPKLTAVSVHANGDHVAKGDPNKDIIKKSTWLKFLVAIPSINGAIAIAIANQYPTMRALLDVYLDRSRPDREKELLLQHLVKETSGGDRRIGPVFSKRIYRMLMARDANLSSEDVEEGADHFT